MDDILDISRWKDKYCVGYNILHLNICRFVFGYTNDELFVAEILSNRMC